MAHTEHVYIGPKCCPCCHQRSGGPDIPHDRHECNPGPQWIWIEHKKDPEDGRGRNYCSCSLVPALSTQTETAS